MADAATHTTTVTAPVQPAPVELHTVRCPHCRTVSTVASPVGSTTAPPMSCHRCHRTTRSAR